MRRISETGAPRIIYLSCNPTTLALDLKDLVAASYAARTVQPPDLFPHTCHVDCAVLLEKYSGRQDRAITAGAQTPSQRAHTHAR